MTVLPLLLSLVALGVAVLALRRVDVVEDRARRWLGAEQLGGHVEEPSLAVSVPRDGTTGLSKFGVVHYDAFEDVGGRLSFSVALLDQAGVGVVLTAIHGRSETRSYLKSVPTDASSRPLSPEEMQAVSQAKSGRS